MVLALVSGNLELNSPTEKLIFLVICVLGFGWMTFAGLRMFRRSRLATARPSPTRGLEVAFGLFLFVVGAGVSMLTLYLLVGGLAGWSGIENLRP